MSLPLLKVITMMEPLKPFIAILVEVTVLVTAILLCERTRSKKNNAAGSQTTCSSYLCYDSFIYLSFLIK